MHVTRFDAAPDYEAPGHSDMRCLRLQGREAGPAVQLWMGMSILRPGGRTTLDPSPMEKLYLVVEGELTLTGEIDGRRDEAVLRANDSCRFAPGEKRQIVNHTDREARIVIAMPLQPPAV